MAVAEVRESFPAEVGPWRMWLATLLLTWAVLDLRGWSQPGASIWWNGDPALCQTLMAWAWGVPVSLAGFGWLLLFGILAPWHGASFTVSTTIAVASWWSVSSLVGRERLKAGRLGTLLAVAGGVAVLRSVLKLWAGDLGIEGGPGIVGHSFQESLLIEALGTALALAILSLTFRLGSRGV